MGLYERASSRSEDVPKLSVHTFSVALRELTRGNVTREQAIAAFELDTECVLELDAIIAYYLTLTLANRPDYIMQIHDAFLLAEAGFYNRDKLVEVLGFG